MPQGESYPHLKRTITSIDERSLPRPGDKPEEDPPLKEISRSVYHSSEYRKSSQPLVSMSLASGWRTIELVGRFTQRPSISNTRNPIDVISEQATRKELNGCTCRRGRCGRGAQHPPYALTWLRARVLTMSFLRATTLEISWKHEANWNKKTRKRS